MDEEDQQKEEKKEKHEYCCERGQSIAGEFCDRMADLDRELFTIGRLCEAITDGEIVDVAVIREVGWVVHRYLDKKWVIENFYFSRHLENKWIDDIFVKTEKMRLEDQSSVFKKDDEKPSIKPNSEAVIESS